MISFAIFLNCAKPFFCEDFFAITLAALVIWSTDGKKKWRGNTQKENRSENFSEVSASLGRF